MYTKVFRISIFHQFHIAQTFVTSHVYKRIKMTEIFQNVMVIRLVMHMMILAALLWRSFNADSFYDRAWSSGWLSISRSRVSLWSGLSGILAVTRDRSKSERLKTSLTIISFHFIFNIATVWRLTCGVCWEKKLHSPQISGPQTAMVIILVILSRSWYFPSWFKIDFWLFLWNCHFVHWVGWTDMDITLQNFRNMIDTCMQTKIFFQSKKCFLIL